MSEPCDECGVDTVSILIERDQLRAKCERLESELKHEKEQHEIDNKGNNEWVESLCSQLCKMEDALGFKNDCYDKKGQWVPTIGPWLERVRDLISSEGELGDIREERDKLANSLRELTAQAAQMREALEFYAKSERWFESFAVGSTGSGDDDIQDGDPMMVFKDGEDHPWSIAQQALSTTAGKSILERISQLEAVVEKCEKALRSIVGDKTKEHFEENGPGAIAGEFDVRDLHMSLDALAAIRELKEKSS